MHFSVFNPVDRVIIRIKIIFHSYEFWERRQVTPIYLHIMVQGDKDISPVPVNINHFIFIYDFFHKFLSSGEKGGQIGGHMRFKY
jgi:hypothetical protein